MSLQESLTLVVASTPPNLRGIPSAGECHRDRQAAKLYDEPNHRSIEGLEAK